jgi:uncharacterized membrane protein YuzA (DUF378 family)
MLTTLVFLNLVEVILGIFPGLSRAVVVLVGHAYMGTWQYEAFTSYWNRTVHNPDMLNGVTQLK